MGERVPAPSPSQNDPEVGLAAHTPGPWNAKDGGATGFKTSSGGVGIYAAARPSDAYFILKIAELDTNVPAEEREANTRLIAAAPDLLAAAREGLIVAEADLEQQRQTCVEHGEDPEADQFYRIFRERRDLIRKAIRKAEGR